MSNSIFGKTIGDSITYRILYMRYQKYFLPSGIIVVCVFLLLFLLIPQTQEYFKTKEKDALLQLEVAALADNIRSLSAIPDAQLANDLDTISAALPPYKDYIGIIRSITRASQLSGVSVNDYEFAIGPLATAAAQQSAVGAIEIDLTLRASLAASQRFVAELTKSLPLSEIIQLENTGTGSTVKVQFIYKPPQQITFQKDTLLPKLTSKDTQTIQKLKQFQSESGNAGVSINTGSGSASASSSASPF